MPNQSRGASLAAGVSLLLAVCTPAWAEKADRDKPIDYSAEHFQYDEIRQVGELSVEHGEQVILTKGSMRLTGRKIEYRVTDRGYKQYKATVAEGELATFHERRDSKTPGVESTVDGAGEQIDYDEESGKVRISRRAVVRFLENGQQRENVNGDLILYDSINDTYGAEGQVKNGQTGRVHGVIPPHRPPAAAEPASPLKPAPVPPAGAP